MNLDLGFEIHDVSLEQKDTHKEETQSPNTFTSDSEFSHRLEFWFFHDYGMILVPLSTKSTKRKGEETSHTISL